MRLFENPADGYNAAWGWVKSSENPDFHRFLWVKRLFLPIFARFCWFLAFVYGENPDLTRRFTSVVAPGSSSVVPPVS
jgi:hypothetical protein